MAKPKILVIEDEPDILEVIQYNLEREGHKVIACRNGEQGLSRIRTDNPDLVVLDLMLPGMDGVEVCRQVKNDPLTRAIPVIMVTAKVQSEDIVEALGLGANDYVTKPVDLAVTLARIKTQLARCAAKIGRTIREMEWIVPEDDFPRHDGRPPLKIALLRV